MKGTSIVTATGPSIRVFRKDAIKVAKEIGYSKDVIAKLEKALNLSEINRILADARHEWDVNPERWKKSRSARSTKISI